MRHAGGTGTHSGYLFANDARGRKGGFLFTALLPAFHTLFQTLHLPGKGFKSLGRSRRGRFFGGGAFLHTGIRKSRHAGFYHTPHHLFKCHVQGRIGKKSGRALGKRLSELGILHVEDGEALFYRRKGGNKGGLKGLHFSPEPFPEGVKALGQSLDFRSPFFRGRKFGAQGQHFGGESLLERGKAFVERPALAFLHGAKPGKGLFRSLRFRLLAFLDGEEALVELGGKALEGGFFHKGRNFFGGGGFLSLRGVARSTGLFGVAGQDEPVERKGLALLRPVATEKHIDEHEGLFLAVGKGFDVFRGKFDDLTAFVHCAFCGFGRLHDIEKLDDFFLMSGGNSSFFHTALSALT